MLLKDDGYLPAPFKGDKITLKQKEELEFALMKLNSSAFENRVDFDDKNQAGAVHGWLVSLGMVVAGTLSGSELAAKVEAYSRLFRMEFKDGYFPLELFNDENLLKAAKKFKYFPTFEEISGFFKAHPAVSLQYDMKWRIKVWLECKVDEPKHVVENPEISAQISEMMAGMFKKLPEGINEQQQIEVTL